MHDQQYFIEVAMELARSSAADNTGPFGCVIVKDGEIIAKGNNQVTEVNDPSAHAEIQAIRKACKHLNNFELEGCDVYTSCYPCPMCLGAIYWARPRAVYYVNTANEAAGIGFDDEFIYEEIGKEDADKKIVFKKVECDDRMKAFDEWRNNPNKRAY